MATTYHNAPTESRLAQRPWYARATPLFVVLCVLIFYFTPLFSPDTSIQGDTADIHLPLQRYIADRIFSGHLPFWTPYIYSGYPILANPLTGAWYPLNWIFLLTGINPLALQLELVLHALLACTGAFIFFNRYMARRGAAMAGAFAYGLSGFFAANSSHLGVFLAAAWFPWLLIAYERAAGSKTLRAAWPGALAGGMLLLSGHIQTACFALLGLVLFAIVGAFEKRVSWRAAASILAVMLLGALAISAVQMLPAIEQSQVLAAPNPAHMAPIAASPRPAALLTLFLPDWLRDISAPTPGEYRYYYGGLLLVPLALVGLVRSPLRWKALVLAAAGILITVAPDSGLAGLTAAIPGTHANSSTAGWFLAAFGLAMLAAAGCDRIMTRSNRAAVIGFIAIGFLFVDLLYWNSVANPMAYARLSYSRKFGEPEMMGRRVLAAPQLPLNRFDSAHPVHGVGPLLHPLDIKLEATYGYLLRESRFYREYREAVPRNPRLLDGLNASRFLNLQAGAIDVNPNVLPRAYFPRAVRDVSSAAESRRVLDTLDPAAESLLQTPHAPVTQDASAVAVVNTFDEQLYRIHYAAQSNSLMRVAVPWYPGWRATVAGHPLKIERVDHAWVGVIVPAGEHDVELVYSSAFFYAGAAVSLLAALALILMAAGPKLYRSLDRLFNTQGSTRRRRIRDAN